MNRIKEFGLTPKEQVAASRFESSVLAEDFEKADDVLRGYPDVMRWCAPVYRMRYAMTQMSFGGIEGLLDAGIIKTETSRGSDFGEFLWEAVNANRVDVLNWAGQRLDQLDLTRDKLTRALCTACARSKANKNMEAAIELLLKFGADVNGDLLEGKHNGVTVHGNGLCNAARVDGVSVTRLLLRYGADANHLGAEGVPPLVVAARVGATDAMTNLVAAGAKTDVPGLIGAAAWDRTGMAISTIKRMEWKFDRTAIDAALMAGVSGLPNSFLTQLIEWGADPKAASVSGETPLSVACNLARFSSAKFFIEQGAQITQKMREDNDRLVIAALKPDTEDSRFVLKFLLEGGFELPQKIQGRTVMQFLSRSSDELKRLVRSQGLKGKIKDALSADLPDASPSSNDAGMSL